jgi:hypothetical protein
MTVEIYGMEWSCLLFIFGSPLSQRAVSLDLWLGVAVVVAVFLMVEKG